MISPGITEKLDYLEWLGVDCLWLLPFYDSPLRDGGYDISDFFTVLPDYGTVGDAAELIEEAHRRNIRVIADMVDEPHERPAPVVPGVPAEPGQPQGRLVRLGRRRDRWAEARVIFVDTEPSNWTWDPQREQYYWHRFFSHQPDLNYDNPEVPEAMLDVVRFWLGLGLDGFRLDAVPYLFERDGTNGENLPETHEYLRRVRRTVDAEFPGRVLLAEANQWPADVVDYFGDGDECHMCFHFPLMPRMFMAVRREQRRRSPRSWRRPRQIPDGCQWGIFLRNHDELTLEMVTDEERDYMYAEYAKDPRMKRNVGIARRLVPAARQRPAGRRAVPRLLFSLPGSPVMYYGDEIGMGDNIYLGDRDGVRTPMQWTPDRNGGFSHRRLRPAVPPRRSWTPSTGSPAVNVESQHARHRARSCTGCGACSRSAGSTPCSASAPSRCWTWPTRRCSPSSGARPDDDGTEDIVLCVNNLSSVAQPVEIALSPLAGKIPVELIGGVHFPPIGELPYFVTLPPYGFYWFSLVDEHGDDLHDAPPGFGS